MKEQVRVLLIEDDPIYTRFIQETIKEIPENPFCLLHTDRLSSGLELLDAEKIDIILLDLMLPDSIMLKTLRRVVEHAPQMPVVVLTTLQDEQTSVSAVQMGAQDYLYKGEVNGALLSRSLRYARERKKVEESLKQVNRNLHLMNSITRHDLLNQLMVIVGYMHLIREDESSPKNREYLDKIEKVTGVIRHQIEFTRTYQNIGARSVQWQNVQETICRAVSLHPTYLISVALMFDMENMDVLADPMLEKVFYNLLDNSLRHGGHVTEIRVSCCEGNEGVYLIWEDNGVGIPLEEKKRIFRLSPGTNKGLGLFLIRSILAITNMEIRETGEPGKAARFEIHIPRGYFRRARPGETGEGGSTATL